MNDALQGSNIDDDLRRAARPAAGPGDRRGRQPDRHQLRLELDARRPDRARQGVVLRRHPLVAARSVPDRRDQPGRFAGHRRQPHPQLRRQGHLAGHADHPHVVPVQQEHQRPLPSPRLALPVRRGQGDRAAEPAGAELRRAVQPRGRLGGWCSTRASAACGASSRSRYQAEVQPTDIAIRDVVRFTRINAAETQSLNPNGRYQGNFTGSYFLDSARRRHPRPQGRPAAVVGAGASTSASATATSSSSCRTACRSRRSSPTRRSTPTIG